MAPIRTGLNVTGPVSPSRNSKPSNIASPLGSKLNGFHSLTTDELEILAIQARKRQILTYENATLAHSHLLRDFEEFEKSFKSEKSSKPIEFSKNEPPSYPSKPSLSLNTSQTAPPNTADVNEGDADTTPNLCTPTPTILNKRLPLKIPEKVSLSAPSQIPSTLTSKFSWDKLSGGNKPEKTSERDDLERIHSTETITPIKSFPLASSSSNSSSPSPSPSSSCTSSPVSLESSHAANQSIDALNALVDNQEDALRLGHRPPGHPWRDIEEPSFLHHSHTSFHLDFLSNGQLEQDEDTIDVDYSTASSESIQPSKWITAHFPILAQTSSASASILPPPLSPSSSKRSLPSTQASTAVPEAAPISATQTNSSLPSVSSISKLATTLPKSASLPDTTPSSSTSSLAPDTQTGSISSSNSSSRNVSTEFTQLQREKQHLEKAKIEFDKEKLKFKQLKDNFERWRQEEWTKIDEEKKKLKRDRMVFEKHKKLNDVLPTKKERHEIDALKAQLQELHETLKQKEIKSKLSDERYKQRVDQLTVANKELKEELLFLQSTPNLSSSPCRSANLKEKMKPASTSLPLLPQTTPESSSDMPTPTSSMAWRQEFERIERNSQLGPFREEKIIKDGLIERRYANGVRVVVFKNGTSKEYLKDKEVIHYLNEDRRESYPDGKVIYYFKQGQIKSTTYPDGTVTNEFADGQFERRTTDGVLHVQFPNGTRRVVHPNGQKEDHYPDGSMEKTDVKGNKTLLHSDGSKEFLSKEKRKRVLPNGEVKILFPDGTRERISEKGRIQLIDSQGNILRDDI